MGQEADGREPDEVGVVRQGGPDGQERGDGRLYEGQLAASGVVGVAWSSRWWVGRGQIRG